MSVGSGDTLEAVRVEEVATPREKRVTLSLISHTNVGKTTLARTLLRKDVGEAFDQRHVTDENTPYRMLEAEGAELWLWDTPGFGDTAKLLKRLRKADKPVGWFLTQVWDRYTDRALYCSQKAIYNVRDECDVVLYLVNASEDPEEAGYVDIEMEILGWLGKPVMVLLNQTGQRRDAARYDRGVEEWVRHLSAREEVSEVLELDAFSRCWVEEYDLIERIARHVPGEKSGLCEAIAGAAQEVHRDILERSVVLLGMEAAAAVMDGEKPEDGNILTALKNFVRDKDAVGREACKHRDALIARMVERSQETTNQLIQLHGLSGKSAEELRRLAGGHSGMPDKVDASLWTLAGAVAGGVVGGALLDLASAALTFGGAAILGGAAGLAVGKFLAEGYNLVMGGSGKLRLVAEHYRGQLERMLLGYLAVAHFGRGRGEWSEGKPPEFWERAVVRVLDGEVEAIKRLWKLAGKEKTTASEIEARATGLMRRATHGLLRELYPESAVLPD